MASSLCDRCGQSTLDGMFTIWHGRMVRVGKDCHAAIQREKELAKALKAAPPLPAQSSQGSGGG